MPDPTVGRSVASGRKGLRRGMMIGCSVWETAPTGLYGHPEYRFIKPLQMDNGLQRRWLVHEQDGPTYYCLDDDFATLTEARESVGV